MSGKYHIFNITFFIEERASERARETSLDHTMSHMTVVFFWRQVVGGESHMGSACHRF